MEPSEIKVLKNIKINDKLSVSLYESEGKEFVGLHHYKFESRIVFQKTTAKKLAKTLTKLLTKGE